MPPDESATPAGPRPQSEHRPEAATSGHPVQIVGTTVRVDLTIDRPAVAAYLEHIAPDKQEIALLHALEVGITELAARRERFKK